MCTYTASGAKANGTTTPCAVASGQAARQSPCIIPSEGRQHRRVTLILFPHVSTCFQMFPVLRQDFHHLCASQDFMGICRFGQGWSGDRVEAKEPAHWTNSYTNLPVHTRGGPLELSRAGSSELDMKEGFLSICCLEKGQPEVLWKVDTLDQH